MTFAVFINKITVELWILILSQHLFISYLFMFLSSHQSNVQTAGADKIRQDSLVLTVSAMPTELGQVVDRKFWNCFVQSGNAVSTTKTFSIRHQFCSHHRQDKTVLSCQCVLEVKLIYVCLVINNTDSFKVSKTWHISYSHRTLNRVVIISPPCAVPWTIVSMSSGLSLLIQVSWVRQVLFVHTRSKALDLRSMGRAFSF